MSDRDQNEGAAIAVVIVTGLLLFVALGVVGLFFFRYAKQNELQSRMVAERELALAAQEQAAAAAAAMAARTATLVETSPSDLLETLEQVLDAQVAAWNEGDIDKYMETYSRSEELTFSSGGKTTRGWEATLARYKDRYRDKRTMGQLTFSEVEAQSLSPTSALVLGRWQLDRGVDPVKGNFSLVMVFADGAWKIIHDHTSVSEEESSEKPPGKDAKPKGPADQ